MPNEITVKAGMFIELSLDSIIKQFVKQMEDLGRIKPTDSVSWTVTNESVTIKINKNHQVLKPE